LKAAHRKLLFARPPVLGAARVMLGRLPGAALETPTAHPSANRSRRRFFIGV
jgi:hypothetical protein